MATYSPSQHSAGQEPSRIQTRPARRGDWWFRLTAPEEPLNATFAQREAARRGRLASLTLLFIGLFTLFPIPNAIIHGQVAFIIVQLITFGLHAFALFVLNKRGHLSAAGWMVMIVIEASFPLSLLALPQGMTLGLMPLFDIVAESLMVVVAFFKPRSIFFIMVVNIVFIVGWLYFGKHTAEISALLASNPYNLLFPAVSLEIYEAVLAFLWVSSATKAIADLDRSEEIIELERRQLKQQEQQLQLKQQLEEGVQQILQTHIRVANGDIAARAPLGQGHILWQIAHSLNNLLSRLQGHLQLQREMQRTREATRLLVMHLRAAKESQQPLMPMQRTGTMLDEVIVELTTLAPEPLPEDPYITGKHPFSLRRNPHPYR